MAGLGDDYFYGEDLDYLFSEDDDDDLFISNDGDINHTERDNRTHKCSTCGKAYALQGWLQRHEQLKHGATSQNVQLLGDTGSTEDAQGVDRAALESEEDEQEAISSTVRAIDDIASKEPFVDVGQEHIIAARQWVTDFPHLAAKLSRDVKRCIPTCKLNQKELDAADLKYMRLSAHPEVYQLGSLLFLGLTMELYKIHLNARTLATSTAPATEPTDDAKAALYYIGGAFLRKLRKCKNVRLRSFVNTWEINVDETAPSPSEWTALQDRGRLIYISSPLYNILLCMERVVRGVLTPQVRGCNLHEACLRAIHADPELKSKWRTATESLDGCLSMDLLQVLSERFVNLRCHAFARKLDQKLKFKVLKAKNAAPGSSLREELRNDTDACL